MSLRDLLDLLQRIAKVNPEALDADVRALDEMGEWFPVQNVGYKTKSKKKHILLEP